MALGGFFVFRLEQARTNDDTVCASKYYHERRLVMALGCSQCSGPIDFFVNVSADSARQCSPECAEEWHKTHDECPGCGEVYLIDEGWINENDPLRQVYCPDCEE